MSLSFQLTSTDFRGVVNRRFWANFLPFPATNQFYFEVGTPNFKLSDVTHDREVELREYREKMPVIVAFTRIFTEKQYCPFCYPHLLELSDRYEEFRAIGFEVLLVTSTDRAASQQVARDLNLKMPLLSDPSCKVFRTYEVGQALGAPLPAQFVLDRDGKLRYRHLFSFLEPNAPLDRLLEIAKPWGTQPKASALEKSAIETETATLKALKPAVELPAPEEPDSAKLDSAKLDFEKPSSQKMNPEKVGGAEGTTESVSSEPVAPPTSEAGESKASDTNGAGGLAAASAEPREEVVEPQVEPMPPLLPEGVFAAGAIDARNLETVVPKVEPAPSEVRAIVPLKRRQPWLDEETEAIDGEIVRDRRDRPRQKRLPQSRQKRG